MPRLHADPLQNWKITGIARPKSLESLSFTNDQFDDTSMAELDGRPISTGYT